MPTTTIRLSDEEHKILEAYCKQHQRTKNDLVREFVRGLSRSSSLSLEQTLLAHDAKDLQLLAVGPGMYECYLDGRFFAFGSYEEVMSKLKE